jgi:hypothetical protein
MGKLPTFSTLVTFTLTTVGLNLWARSAKEPGTVGVDADVVAPLMAFFASDAPVQWKAEAIPSPTRVNAKATAARVNPAVFLLIKKRFKMLDMFVPPLRLKFGQGSRRPAGTSRLCSKKNINEEH